MARIVTFPAPKPDEGPVVGSITAAAWAEPPIPRDPVVAAERMWWRRTGRLAYAAGVTFSAIELPLLVPNAEHEANMRAGISDAEAPQRHPSRPEPLVQVETRIITHAPEVRDLESDDEPRRPGRPRLPRDAEGNVLR